VVIWRIVTSRVGTTPSTRRSSRLAALPWSCSSPYLRKRDDRTGANTLNCPSEARGVAQAFQLGPWGFLPAFRDAGSYLRVLRLVQLRALSLVPFVGLEAPLLGDRHRDRLLAG
jgi:hypothetical protein